MLRLTALPIVGLFLSSWPMESTHFSPRPLVEGFLLVRPRPLYLAFFPNLLLEKHDSGQQALIRQVRPEEGTRR